MVSPVKGNLQKTHGASQWLSSKESACDEGDTGNSGDEGSVPGLGRSLGGGNGNALQYSCLENTTDSEPGGLQPLSGKELVMTEEAWYACRQFPHLFDNIPKAIASEIRQIKI